MIMTPKREFVLRQLSERDQSSWAICKAAIAAGLNDTYAGSYEWADKPLLWLRKQGLAERTGDRDCWGRSIHRITDSGRDRLAALP